MNTHLKVLVLGSTGMLGHQVVSHLTCFPNLSIVDIAHKNRLRSNSIIMDVMDKNKLETTILDIKPDVIVNCIGVLINGAKDEARAIYLNSYLPHQLKKLVQILNSKLIHISTDCVFSGRSGKYIENDDRDGVGVYSKTKILGEVIDQKNLTIRTSIVGPELKVNGEGLFNWFMTQEKSILGYEKNIWSGVTTLELAKAIKWSIDYDVNGLYHVTNNKNISKYDLLRLFAKHTGVNLAINAVAGVESDKSFIDTRLLLDYKIPSYDEMICTMVNDIRKHPLVYPQYRVS